jgi:hypothetical protein
MVGLLVYCQAHDRPAKITFAQQKYLSFSCIVAESKVFHGVILLSCDEYGRDDAKLQATPKNAPFPRRLKSDSRMLNRRGIVCDRPAGIF